MDNTHNTLNVVAENKHITLHLVHNTHNTLNVVMENRRATLTPSTQHTQHTQCCHVKQQHARKQYSSTQHKQHTICT